MTRRIGLAQALINDPDLVLLDEPTSGLDPIATRDMKNLILDLKAQGKTVIMSSHLLADVQEVCDRIAMLVQGELKILGPVADVLQTRDESQIVTTKLSDAAIKDVEAALQKHGVKMQSVSHPTVTLEELFLKTVEEAKAHPGRRFTPDAKG